VHEILIKEFPQINIEIIIVWIDMLAADNAITANEAAKIFQDDNVIQFYDPNRLVGKAIADSLGANNAVGWDIYLFYKAESIWGEKPPLPLTWAHQLDDLWADPTRFAWENNLPIRFRDIMNNLTET